MKKIILLFFFLIIYEVQSKEEKNNEKVLKISESRIFYDSQRLRNLLSDLNYYNFFEDTGITPIIRDQKSCGSCWAIAITTALSYRFKLKEVNVDLSPQQLISCLTKNCKGFNELDAALSVYYNGSFTEECFPYSSGNGKVEACRFTCDDGSFPDRYHRYFGKNIFQISHANKTEEEYYQDLSMIIVQLRNKGPVVTGIDVYEDLENINNEECKKADFIYSYDGKSPLSGRHAAVIVGYGMLNGIYYWLVQNSYGKDYCDNGFIKIKFGEIGIENVTFIEPYIASKFDSTKTLYMNPINVEENCSVSISMEDDYLKEMDDSFSLEYEKLENNSIRLFFHCGTFEYFTGKIIQCYHTLSQPIMKGNYQYYRMDKSKINYNLRYGLKKRNFTYYGETVPIHNYNKFTYITNNSRIVFNLDDNLIIPNIYANIKAENPLSDCNMFEFENECYVYCKIKEEELEDFKNNKIYDYPIVSNKLCGVKEPIDYKVYVLDTTKYPAFYFKKFTLKTFSKINFSYKAELMGYIEGNFSEFNLEKSYFTVDLIINEDNSKKNSFFMDCRFKLGLSKDNLTAFCDVRTGSYNIIDVKGINFPPTEIKKTGENIFEVIFSDHIQVVIDKNNKNSYLQYRLSLIYILIILLL